MKNNKLFLSLVASLLFVTVGCDKEFLETEPTAFITQEQLAAASVNNPDLIRGTVSGIYSLMFETGTLPTIGHKISIENWVFEVIDLDGRRIDKVLAIFTPSNSN